MLFFYILPAGTDYSIIHGQGGLTFTQTNFEQPQCIFIDFVDDNIAEGSEQFLLVLNTSSNVQRVDVGISESIINIIDNDGKLVE